MVTDDSWISPMSNTIDGGQAQDSSKQKPGTNDEFSTTASLSPCTEVQSDLGEFGSMDFDFHPLDVRAIRLWRLEGLIFALGGWLALLAVGCLLWAVSSVPVTGILLFWLLVLGVSVSLVIWWPQKCYASWSYCLEPRTLELRHGVVWKVSVLIPLSRVQHVDLHRNPLERRLGLASLQIHTAGTRDASHQLPALDGEKATDLRQRLITFSNGEAS